MSDPTTIIDVLDNALDGELTAECVQRMTLAEVHALREVVLQFYEAWAPYPAEEGLQRVHLGGWVASASGGLARDILHAALLYSHQVVIHDPVAAYFEPGRHRLRVFPPVLGTGIDSEASAIQQERSGGYEARADDVGAHHAQLGDAIGRLGAIAPLIRSGIVVPIPHLKLTLQRQERIWTAVRRLLADDRYVAAVEHVVDRPALAQDGGPSIHFLTQPRTARSARIQAYGDPAYYLSRSIAMADAAYASYLPPSGTEWAIYAQRLEGLGSALGRQHLELTVAPALIQSELPYFEGLEDADLVAIRRDEEGFEHWRSSLRAASRHITTLPSEGSAFAYEARQVLGEHLDEAAAEVRHSTSLSARLRASARPTALTVVSGAAGLAATTAGGAEATGLKALAITGMLRWLGDTLLPPHLAGSKGVLSHLLHNNPPDSNEGWPVREPLLIQRNRGAATSS